MGAAVKRMAGGGRVRHLPPKRRPPSSPLDKAKAWEVDWPKVSALFDATRGAKGAVFVYCIGEQDNGAVKIGFAKDPIKRLRSMQTGNPRRLRVERVLIGDIQLEKLLHEFWESFAIVAPAQAKKPDAAPGTEWFRAEIRERLYPIVECAAEHQVDLLADPPEDLAWESFEQAVRGAHKIHDFVVHQRHQVRLLGAVAGYVTPRPSRL